jgi:signal transduction histidine kinase
MENKLHLLLIEDNIHDAKLFSENLNLNYNNEFEIDYSLNLKSGVEKATNKEYDIIVSDLNLSDSTGLNTFNEIKKAAGGTPVIILSGLSDSNLTIEAIKSGAQDYIYKGFYESDFIYRVIRYAIERKKLVSEIEEKSRELAKINEDLKELITSRERMYSIISHDLLNPVNAIQGYTELLSGSYNEFSEEERLNAIKTLSELSMNVSGLFKDLLLWTSINTGHLESNPEKLNIETLLRNQIEFQKAVARKKNIEIIGENKEMYIYADKMMIETVIRNLISNSIKFTNSQGKIYVNNYELSEEVVVEIEDTGVGMDEDEISKLFKPEEKISRKGTNQEKGMGLGLLVCKEFLNRNGGTIEVTSKKNIGTTFQLKLPKTLK